MPLPGDQLHIHGKVVTIFRTSYLSEMQRPIFILSIKQSFNIFYFSLFRPNHKSNNLYDIKIYKIHKKML